MLSGSGLLPEGGADAVIVIFGDVGTQKICTLVDVKFNYISCLVPDFSIFKARENDMEVPISVEMGFLRENPFTTQTLKFKFMASLLSTIDTMTQHSHAIHTTATITGTNLGTDSENIQVFAQHKTGVGRRKRATHTLSLTTMPAYFHLSAPLHLDTSAAAEQQKLSTTVPWRGHG